MAKNSVRNVSKELGIASMTGYGRAFRSFNGYNISVELRSVNNRYCDIVSHLPRVILQYEQEVKDLIRQSISRGKINVNISISGLEVQKLDLKIDETAARGYYQLLQKLCDVIGVKQEINLGYLLNFSDIIIYDSSEKGEEELWEQVKNVLSEAVKNLKKTRIKEGNELAKDISDRVKAMNKTLDKIEKLSKNSSKEELKKLKKRIKTLVDSKNYDSGRLEMEMALIADKIDITEECVRFKSHNKLFLDTLKTGEGGGRKLNFILQEMNREANTISAKTNNVGISHFAVNLKEEIEKIREQVQNIE
jgi:uncharacterized protein (TIGR00255 family)